MRVLDPATIARAALKAIDDRTLCAIANKGPWYRNPGDPDDNTTCAIGAGLTEEERLEAQQANKYEIAYLVTHGMFSVADPAHLDQLTQLQNLHDKATESLEDEYGEIPTDDGKLHAFLDYARSLC